MKVTLKLQAYYVRADDLLAVMRPLVPAPVAPGDWLTRYVHADGIGSIRRLTNEAGTITDGYTYSAFGELIAHTGTDPQPYAFAGEPYDPNSGFQYHRARWLDPQYGRFASTDSFAGFLVDPPSLHRYTYAHTNPIGYVDPSGEMTTVQNIAVGAIIGILVAQAIPAQSFEDRLKWTLLAAAVGSIGGAVAAGATLGGLIVTITATSVWLLPPLIRGRVIERALGSNLPYNYPVIDRFVNGVVTSIKSIDLTARTYQNIPALSSTLRGYVDAVGGWQGRSAPWGWQPAIPGTLIRSRELLVAIPAQASALQMHAIRQVPAYALTQNVRMYTVTIH